MTDAPAPRGYRALLSNRRFRFYFASLATGEAGYAAYAVSVVWLALRIPGGGAEFAGLVLGVEFAVYALSFLAGPWVDRARDLRRVLLVGYPLQGALSLLIVALALSGQLSPAALLASIAGLSVLWDFTWTASNAMLPRVVEGPSLLRANGLTNAVSGSNQLAGFAAGGLLLVVAGPVGGAAFYAAANFLAALLAVPVRAPSAAPAGPAFRPELAAGWRYFAGGAGRPLVQLSAFSATQGFFSAAPVLLLALLSVRRFAEPSLAYAALYTAFGVGNILGSLGVGVLDPRRRLPVLLAVASAAEGLLVALSVVAAPAWLPSLALWLGVGAADVGVYSGLVAYLQARTPQPLLGRTLANHYLFRGSARAAGAMVFGLLAATVALGPLAAVVGAVFLCAGLVLVPALPAIRRLAF